MQYKDHFTKFCVLRPLKSKCAAEVALNHIDIFCDKVQNYCVDERKQNDRLIQWQKTHVSTEILDDRHLRLCIANRQKSGFKDFSCLFKSSKI